MFGVESTPAAPTSSATRGRRWRSRGGHRDADRGRLGPHALDAPVGAGCPSCCSSASRSTTASITSSRTATSRFDTVGAVLAVALACRRGSTRCSTFASSTFRARATSTTSTAAESERQPSCPKVACSTFNIAEDYSGQTYLLAFHLASIHSLRDSSTAPGRGSSTSASGSGPAATSRRRIRPTVNAHQTLYVGVSFNAQGASTTSCATASHEALVAQDQPRLVRGVQPAVHDRGRVGVTRYAPAEPHSGWRVAPRSNWPSRSSSRCSRFYLLTSSREPAWGDAHGMWEVAERLVDARPASISRRAGPRTFRRAATGKYYGIAPIGPSLVHVPGVAIAARSHAIRARRTTARAAARDAPRVRGARRARVRGVLRLARAISGSGRAPRACRPRSSRSRRRRGSTRACRTRRSSSSRASSASFRAGLRMCEAPSAARRAVARRLGRVLAQREVRVRARDRRRRRVDRVDAAQRGASCSTVVLWAAVTGVPLLGLALFYNWARWGSITATGYEPYLDAFFGGSMFDGAWGMLASPNKSAFLYSPPLVLALLGLPAAIRAQPRFGVRARRDGRADVPRLLHVSLVERRLRVGPAVLRVGRAGRCSCRSRCSSTTATAWKRARRGGGRSPPASACSSSASSLYWDHFIRIAIDAKNQWLGQPNRAGSYIAEKGRGHCDSCFEDTYEILWTPAFQPIRGHWWLAQIARARRRRGEAQPIAPWRSYTTLDVQPRRRLSARRASTGGACCGWTRRAFTVGSASRS